jgi:hypothetical protein
MAICGWFDCSIAAMWSCIHSWIGELALGSAKIAPIMDDLHDLPRATVANIDEVLKFIADRKLAGSGIGYVDAHLLAAAAVARETFVWTRGKR